MGRNRKNFWLFGILALWACSSCGRRESPGPPAAFSPAETKGDLRVLSATPRGPTAAASESARIVVVFDHPMVPLEALPEERGPSLLSFDPPVAGRHRWLGTRALAFTPDERLPSATEYKVTIAAGTGSPDGYVLESGYSWSFETLRPGLVRHFPQNDQRGLKLDTGILLVFNQPVSESSARKAVSLTGTDGQGTSQAVGFTVRRPSDKLLKDSEIQTPADRTLLLEPRQGLKRDFAYTVVVRAGFAGTEGHLGTPADEMFRFETFRTFRFELFGARDGHNPHQPLRFQFSNPVSVREFIEKTKFDPPVHVPDYYLEWDHASGVLWLDLPLEPETPYTVRIPAELKDEFGNPLGRAADLRFTTGSYPPSVTMTEGHGIVESYGNLLYPITAMNAAQVAVQAAKIAPEDVIPFLNSPKTFWGNERISPGSGFYSLEKTLELPRVRNKAQSVPVDLGPLLPDRHGLVFLQLNTGLRDAGSRYPKAFLQATELGLSAKFSPDNNVLWVTELRSGRPLPGVAVELRDDDNGLRWTGKTDDAGRAESPGWKVLGLNPRSEWEKPRQWFFAHRGQDAAFISSEWGSGIDPYRFGIDYDWNPEPPALDGSVFTERGIYRAGETVHVKGILRDREKGEWRIPRAVEVQCVIQDPFQKPVLEQRIRLDEFGSFGLDVDIQTDAPLGSYSVRVTQPAEAAARRPATIYGSFRVEAFRPAEFEVLVRSLSGAYVFGEAYEADIRASYLSGGAMSGQPVSWRLRLNPSSFRPPGYEGYVFGNRTDWENWDAAEGSRLLASGEARLNPEGRIAVKIPLVAEKETDGVEATLEATVTSPSRRAISNRIQTTVHRGSFYIGLRPNTAFLQKGSSLTLDVVAADAQGKLMPKLPLTVKLCKREWRSVRKAGVGGRLQWISEKEDIETASEGVVTRSAPVSLTLRPDKSGLYVLRAEGKDSGGNPVTTSAFFYVTGPDYVPWEQRDDDTIELVPDAAGYRPGDTARILVKSPYEKARAFVTIERESILETMVLDAVGTSSRIEIPVRPEYVPNVFVSVLLVQGRTSEKASAGEDVGRPSFKIGYVPLAVDPFAKKLDVDVVLEKEEYRPRERVRVRFKVRTVQGKGVPACLSVAAVDAGVLNLIGYRTPDPFAHFYSPKPLSVQTSETRLHLVGQRSYGEKGEEVGGGAGELAPGGLAGLSQVELRGDFKSTAYWNPALLTDADGVAEAGFDLPDNLTSFRIMAVAQTKDSDFGYREAGLRVSQPLQLLPSVPRFARLGDAFEGGVVVRNLSKARADVEMSLESEGLLCPNPSPRTISLEAGQARETLFPFEAREAGTARLKFRARTGGEEDGLIVRIPVLEPRPSESVALFDSTDVSKTESVRIPGDALLDLGGLEISASSTALSGLRSNLGYLHEYPYACLEQKLSAVLPYIVGLDMISAFRLSPMPDEDVRKFVRKTLIDVAGFQKDDGGFGLWPNSSASSPYASCYAVFTLLKARAAGWEPDSSGLERGLQYLRNMLREKSPEVRYPFLRGPGWRTTLAFALYTLTLSGKPEPAYAERLFAARKDLTLFGRVLLLKSLPPAAEARASLLDELLNKIKVEATEAHFEEDPNPDAGWIYSSNLKTTAAILQALVETGADHPLIPQIARWLVEKQRSAKSLTTQENFYFIQALSDYYRTYESARPDFDFKIHFRGRTLLEGSFGEGQTDVRTAASGLKDLVPGETVPLVLEKRGQGRLFYGARMRYVPAGRAGARDEGITVVKSIQTPDGRPLTSVKAGMLAVVTLDLVLPEEGLFIVVDDPLPAGFEAVNPNLETESGEDARALEALDGGRAVRWWEGFHHIEMRDDRVLLFADSLLAGAHTHRYLVRALTPGVFQTPGTKAERMYAPEVFGRTGESVVKVDR